MIIEYKTNNGFKAIEIVDTSDDTKSAIAPPPK